MVGFSPELVAWWARGSVRAGWAAAGYLSANGCRVRSTRQFLCWTFKKKKLAHYSNTCSKLQNHSNILNDKILVALLFK
ncbi:hypothetical protein Hanom_Chr14g01333111 [Helianthus anomalus]